MSRTISFTVTEDQYQLARRRAFVEDLGWKPIMNALLNAYIAGDITVTQQGRYSIAPPQSATPVVHVRSDADLIELEPDWNINDPRPQVGSDPSQQTKPRSGWGTTALKEHIAKETGRNIPKQYLRQLLKLLDIDKADNGRWYFEGPTDPVVATILSAVETGVYDDMVRRSLEGLRDRASADVTPTQRAYEADLAKHEEAKRRRFAERLKQRES